MRGRAHPSFGITLSLKKIKIQIFFFQKFSNKLKKKNLKSRCHTKRRAGAATGDDPSFGVITTQVIRDLFALCCPDKDKQKMFHEYLKNSSLCQGLPDFLLQVDGEGVTAGPVGIPAEEGAGGEGGSVGVKANIPRWQIVLIILALGIFTAFIAKLFNWIRQHIYKDKVCFSYHLYQNLFHIFKIIKFL